MPPRGGRPGGRPHMCSRPPWGGGPGGSQAQASRLPWSGLPSVPSGAARRRLTACMTGPGGQGREELGAREGCRPSPSWGPSLPAAGVPASSGGEGATRGDGGGEGCLACARPLGEGGAPNPSLSTGGLMSLSPHLQVALGSVPSRGRQTQAQGGASTVGARGGREGHVCAALSKGCPAA